MSQDDFKSFSVPASVLQTKAIKEAARSYKKSKATVQRRENGALLNEENTADEEDAADEEEAKDKKERMN